MIFKLLKNTFFLFLLFSYLQGYSQSENIQREVNIRIENPVNQTIIQINLPDSLPYLATGKKTTLVFYALPNGNSIEWTMGKRMQAGDDWHYAIQHIAAQARYLRRQLSDENIILVYLASFGKSWPAWKRARTNGPAEIRRLVDSVSGAFTIWHPQIVLDSHSGGGSFIFGYLDAVDQIPSTITRIAFIDSDYGYEDSLHTEKLVHWLQSSPAHHLSVLAYNDSVVIYNGKPLVSPRGGTWYRSRWLLQQLSRHFRFQSQLDTSFLHYSALQGRIDIWLKTNKNGLIYHTEQVYRNGFIQSLLSGTPLDNRRYRYWGKPVYSDYISP
ncbi:MAG TPA: hypothetical protein VG842_11170 [Sediminibacterium sp.]|nr:hypothetical protein [Sediminibacterium sp.]